MQETSWKSQPLVPCFDTRCPSVILTAKHPDFYPRSRAVAYRFGKHLDVTVPLVTSYCDAAAEGDDELRELCLQVRG